MKARLCRAAGTLAAGLLGLSLLAACSTQQRHAWMTVFFEGVPPLEGEAPAAATNTAALPGNGIHPPHVKAPPVAWVQHEPFKSRRCNVCHTSTQSQELRGSQREICSACHSNVLTGVAVEHWPVKKWKCTACHEPHKSTLEKLLKRPSPALCYDCHDPLNQKHYIHEPVRRGRCQSCHTAHESPYRALLKQDGDAMCLKCHEADEMQALPSHAGMGAQTCVPCHDPHQSDKKGLMR